MWQWCVYVSVLSVVWMPVVFQNVSKHGRSSWTSFWKPYMMISIEELEVSHPKVCHAVSRQAQGHSFWRFSMERCSYYKKEPTGSVFLVASTPSKTKSLIQCGCISPWLPWLFGKHGLVIRWVLKFCAHCAAVAGSSRAGSKSKLRKEPGDPSFIALYPTLPDSTRLYPTLPDSTRLYPSTLWLAGTCCGGKVEGSSGRSQGHGSHSRDKSWDLEAHRGSMKLQPSDTSGHSHQSEKVPMADTAMADTSWSG